jgi:tetratricopeptide (TPR) repeat protein
MTAGYSTRDVAKLLKVPEPRVREFVRAGVLGPRELPAAGEGHRFDFRDVLVLRMAARLVGNGLPPRRVKRALLLLRDQIRGDRPLSGVQLFAENGRVLASDGQALWEPESGQHHLRFEAPVNGDAEPATPAVGAAAATAAIPVPVRPVQPTTLPDTADGWFDLAMQLEDVEPHRAYEAYLKALESNPEHVDAYINVGRLCSAAGEFERAAAFFRQAIRIDPTHPVAHFNLAVTLHDLGELPAARDAYRSALASDPHFADAHYNLAALLEQMGDRDGASRHRQLYDAVLRQPGQ